LPDFDNASPAVRTRSEPALSMTVLSHPEKRKPTEFPPIVTRCAVDWSPNAGRGRAVRHHAKACGDSITSKAPGCMQFKW